MNQCLFGNMNDFGVEKGLHSLFSYNPVLQPPTLIKKLIFITGFLIFLF